MNSSSNQLATKADLAAMQTRLIKWMISLSFALGAFLAAVMAWLK